MSKYTHTLNYSIEVEDEEILVGNQVYHLTGEVEFDITTELVEGETNIVHQELEDDNGQAIEITPEIQKEIDAFFDKKVSDYIEDNAEDIAREVETDWDEESDYRSHRRY